MKTLLKMTMFALVAQIALSCGSSKVEVTKDAKEVVLPIPNFNTDKANIRAVGTGTSPNISMAKEMAYTDAARQIAQYINTKLKSVFEGYQKQADIETSIDYKSEVERMTTTSVSESLKNLKIAKEKLYQNPDKTYTYWLGVELNKEELLNSLSNRISNTKLKELHESKVDFRETFNKNFDE